MVSDVGSMSVSAGRLEQLGKVTFPSPGEVRLVLSVRIDVVHRLPERRERAAAPGVIPHAGGDPSARPGDPSHLRQPGHGIGHEMNDQLGERGVELVVREGQLLGGAGPHVDPRDAFAQRRDERGGRIDRRDGVDAESLHQQRGQCAGSATDVEHPLTCLQIRHLHELDGQWFGEPTHEQRVGVPRDVEGHRATVLPDARRAGRPWSAGQAGHARRQEARAVDPLADAGAVEVRRDAAEVERPAGAEQHREVDVLDLARRRLRRASGGSPRRARRARGRRPRPRPAGASPCTKSASTSGSTFGVEPSQT